MRLLNKVSLITGGGSGIGREMAITFAKEGSNVIVVDIDRLATEEIVKLITSQGGTAYSCCADITKEQEVLDVINFTESQIGKLHILINNAGLSLIKPLFETTTEDFYRIIDINVMAIFLLCKNAIPLMLKSGGGSIINIASLSALRSRPNMPLYAASKGAITALTRSLAIDFGRKNIRANCICPAATATPMLVRHYDSIDDGDIKRLAAEKEVPLGRFALPDDIAQLAVFLSSDESQYISGQTIAVDGGLLAGTALI